ncbi:MAG: HPP family protein [Solirubrobacterales bacterium]|nr:HPP family protein [Solirubrobacterales bacterium]
MNRPTSNISDMLPRRAEINDVSVPYRSGATYIVVMGTFLTAVLCAFAVVTSEPFVVPSIGPTIFIIVGFPLSEQAHPRNILYSTAIAIVAGIVGLAIFGLINVPPDLADLTWVRAGALTVAVAIAVTGIIVSRSLHAPSVATAMIIAAGLLNGPFDWLSVFIGVLVVTIIGVAVNRACGKPQALWWRPQPSSE